MIERDHLNWLLQSSANVQMIPVEQIVDEVALLDHTVLDQGLIVVGYQRVEVHIRTEVLLHLRDHSRSEVLQERVVCPVLPQILLVPAQRVVHDDYEVDHLTGTIHNGRKRLIDVCGYFLQLHGVCFAFPFRFMRLVS